MKTKAQRLFGTGIVLAFGVVVGFSLRNDNVPELSSLANAATTPVSAPASLLQEAPEYSPVKARARDFYVPNSEDLGPDEMRLIACGTIWKSRSLTTKV